jgi:hypothetical protein
MARSKISRLAMAIAAAALISAGSALPAKAYAMDAADVVQTLNEMVQAADLEGALALIARLRALGITEIEFDGVVISVADLERAVANPNDPASQIILANAVAAAATASVAVFLADDVVIASVESEQVLSDAFATGSVG